MDVGWIFQCFVRESLPNAAILTSLLTSLYTLTSSHLSYNLTSLNVTNKKVLDSNSFRHEWWFGDQVALAKLASLQKAGHKVPGWAISAKWAAHQRHHCITPAATSSSEFHVTSFNYVLSMKPWILHLFGKTAWKHVFWFQFKETDCIIFSWEGCFWEVGKIMWEM